MKLQEAREAYYEFSGKLSDVTRQLCFAGIGVIWIFRSGSNNGGIKYEEVLSYPLYCFSLSLLADFLHYVSSTSVWGIFSRYRELKGAKPETKLGEVPSWFNAVSVTCLGVKAGWCLIGQLLLVIFLKDKI